MASVIIHLSVAKRVAKILDIDSKDFMIGSIAPDCAKIVGLSRKVTHYIPENMDSDTPVIDTFINKYKSEFDKPFELGCLVHLLTDVLWFDEFLPNFHEDDYTVINKDGEKVKLNGITFCDLIYNDYTNVNFELTKYYDLDLGIFYKRDGFPNSHIDEIKNEYFAPLMEKMNEISMSSCEYSYLFDKKDVVHFVEYASLYVLDQIKLIKGV